MTITTILFDLDGTLLPMDQDNFIRGYFGRLAKTAAPYGYDPKALTAAVWAGTEAMVRNQGAQTNEEVFWQTAAAQIGEHILRDRPMFDRFYETEFQKVQQDCGFNPAAAQTVALCKELGFSVALATNPFFPNTATVSRIRWAGLTPEAFLCYTTYENTHFCKPNPAYYTELTDRLGLDPKQCLMVGNDATEDLAAAKCGMQVFLLTDCLIAREGFDLSAVPHGGFPELQQYLQILAQMKKEST